MKSFDVIAAVDTAYGIGLNNDIPWRKQPFARDDMKHFITTTAGRMTSSGRYSTALIMGRLTAESIPRNRWPMAGRMCIVVTSNVEKYTQSVDGQSVSAKGAVSAAKSFNEALAIASDYDNIYVIGGHGIYKEALVHPLCNRVIITRIPGDYHCDVKFPSLDNYDMKVYEIALTPSSDVVLKYSIYMQRDNLQENSYLNLLQSCLDIADSGKARPNRTTVDTYGGFMYTLNFNLQESFPLLTTKKLHFKSVFHELMWFLRGENNIKSLQEAGVRIWNANTTDAVLHARGLQYPEGTVGPAYGHQWRHFGAAVDEKTGERTEPGVDQISNLIQGLKQDPYGRRHIVSAWNPAQTNQAALPPCHVMFQMYVDNGSLHASVYMRSSDVFLGLPFNIASYALLTHLVAHVCGYSVGILTFTLGDYHLYSNHVAAAKLQCSRRARRFPTIRLNIPVDAELLGNIKFEDIVLDGYYPHDTISASMAV